MPFITYAGRVKQNQRVETNNLQNSTSNKIKSSKDEEGFTVVARRHQARKRPVFTYGTGNDCSNLSDFSKDDIIDYVKQKYSGEISCEELTVKPNSYKSFKIEVPVTSVNILLDPQFWPANVAIRKFIDYSK